MFATVLALDNRTTSAVCLEPSLFFLLHPVNTCVYPIYTVLFDIHRNFEKILKPSTTASEEFLNLVCPIVEFNGLMPA